MLPLRWIVNIARISVAPSLGLHLLNVFDCCTLTTRVRTSKGKRQIRKDHPHTPDGRYFVAKGRLNRCTNPALTDNERRGLIKTMMQGRMALRRATTPSESERARDLVHEAKVALGERGPVWWDDGAADYSGQDPLHTPYAEWWRSTQSEP